MGLLLQGEVLPFYTVPEVGLDDVYPVVLEPGLLSKRALDVVDMLMQGDFMGGNAREAVLQVKR